MTQVHHQPLGGNQSTRFGRGGRRMIRCSDRAMRAAFFDNSGVGDRA
jgi:hypothetical protein